MRIHSPVFFVHSFVCFAPLTTKTTDSEVNYLVEGVIGGTGAK